MRTNNEIGADIAVFLANQRPQVVDKRLHWYFAGSLATLILSQAESMVEYEIKRKKCQTKS